MIEPSLGISPTDDHNRRLVANVHPPEWKNPAPDGRYNLVVVGAGTAGLVAAAGAAGLGAKVALVERHLMGGDCLNVGCVPSKTLIRSGRAAADVSSAQRFGIRAVGGVDVDFDAVMNRVRRVRAQISPHDSARRFSEHYGVDVFFGAARFTGPDTVDVGGTTLDFSTAVIATGARPAMPPIPGLAAADPLTNLTVFNLTELPPRLAVIGGGPIGCELAQAFARLGSEVTVVETADRLLAREDRDAAEILRASLIRDGVDLRLQTTVERVDSVGVDKVLHLVGPSGPEPVVVDAIVVGVGRVPNVEGLGLEAAGVQVGPGGVVVNDFLQTSNRRIFASGDVCLPHKFTHSADAASRAVIQNGLFPGPKKRLSRLVIPWCTYTDPEIAHVGLSTHEADVKGLAVDTITIPMAEVDRAVTDGDDHGFLKVHLRKGSDEIVGATIVSRHAGDLISEITAAMVTGTGLGALAGVIHPYPTSADVIRKAADAYNRTRLTPLTVKLLKHWFRWTR